MRPVRRSRVASIAATIVTLVAWATWPAPGGAHHAWTEIDTGRTMTLTGTVRLLHWENPHASLLLETVEDGRRTEWTVMMSGIARMEGHGLTPQVLAQGRTLTVIASPSRDAPRVVRANRIDGDGHSYVLY